MTEEITPLTPGEYHIVDSDSWYHDGVDDDLGVYLLKNPEEPDKTYAVDMDNWDRYRDNQELEADGGSTPEPEASEDTTDNEDIETKKGRPEVPELKYHESGPIYQIHQWLNKYDEVSKNDRNPRVGLRTEVGAEAIGLHKELAYVDLEEKLYSYDPRTGTWDDDGKKVVNHILDKGFRDLYSAQVYNETLGRIETQQHIEAEDFKPSEGMIPVENGILDLETLELRDIKPDDYVTAKIDKDRNPEADAPQFREAIERAVRSGNDRKKLQEYAGYILQHWSFPHQKALFMPGPRASGKSTFTGVLDQLLPEELTSASSPHKLTQRFGKACLHGKWLNTNPEVEADTIKNYEVFKTITGGDKVDAEIKYVQEPLSFHPTCKHIYAANQLPPVYNVDKAFWRRILVVPFPNTISEEDRIDDYAEKLVEEEGAGILNWMIEGYKRLQEQGGFTQDRDIEDTKSKWYAWSTPVLRFYARCLRNKVGAKESTEVVYDAYQDFVVNNMDETPEAKAEFSKNLKRMPHIDITQERSGKSYTGVELADGV